MNHFTANRTQNCKESMIESNKIRQSWLSEPDDAPDMCRKFGIGFPSAGGEGCACPCGAFTTSHETRFAALDHKWPPELYEGLFRADQALHFFREGKYNKNLTLDYSQSHVRIPFLHHCCLTEAQQYTIKRMINSQPAQHATLVSFDRLDCVITGPNGRVTIILLLDEASRHALALRALILTKQLAARGITTLGSMKRKTQFGIVLGTVPGNYPCKPALAYINGMIRNGTWTRSHIPLEKFSCPTC
eukprot:gene13659-29035_t